MQSAAFATSAVLIASAAAGCGGSADPSAAKSAGDSAPSRVAGGSVPERLGDLDLCSLLKPAEVDQALAGGGKVTRSYPKSTEYAVSCVYPVDDPREQATDIPSGVTLLFTDPESLEEAIKPLESDPYTSEPVDGLGDGALLLTSQNGQPHNRVLDFKKGDRIFSVILASTLTQGTHGIELTPEQAREATVGLARLVVNRL